ncbi:MAG: hypothetical protein P9L96_01990 [Candidatus Gygaella obscura]|nr:hypothetical protein [Candidatus Gygaella obscura]
MTCPYFKDYSRECREKIGEIPSDTFYFCDSEKYADCPFYIKIEKTRNICKNIDQCKAFSFFKTNNFDKFLKITETFCLSGNNINCKRYMLKESGRDVFPDLHPDGSKIEGFI